MTRVELCGRLADPVGAWIAIALPPSGLSAGEVMELVAAQDPALAEVLANTRVRPCVNDVIVTAEFHVEAGDRIALFPPVSGG